MKGPLHVQIWASYPEHVGPQGLSTEGLLSIYTSGLADADRDYGLVCHGNESALPGTSGSSRVRIGRGMWLACSVVDCLKALVMSIALCQPLACLMSSESQ